MATTLTTPPERLVEVAVAFIDSVGRPGWGRRMVQRRALALGAWARSITATAAGIHEPGVSEVLNNEEGARLRNALARMAEMANDGMLAEAARTFVTVVATNRELAAAASAGYETRGARYVPIALQSSSKRTSTPQMRRGRPTPQCSHRSRPRCCCCTGRTSR